MNEKTQELLTDWWDALQKDNGGRAQLKRCQTPEDAALLPQTFRLKQMLSWMPLEAVAVIAGVGAHIKESNGTDFGKALATPHDKNGRVPLSESRFRQLLSARDWTELYRSLRRAVTILDGKVGFINFVDTVELWSKELRGEYAAAGKSVKFKLSEAYYTEAMKHE